MSIALPRADVWRREGVVPPSRLAVSLRPLRDCLEQACHHGAGEVALAGTAERLSRPDLLERMRRVAARVQRCVPRGGVVVAVVPQTPSGVAALLGCASAGRICVVLNPADPPERLRLALGETEPAALLFDETLAETLPWPAGARALALADCLAGDGEVAPEPHDPDAPCMVHYTSGSTGRPKGVVLSSHAILWRAAVGIERQFLGPADRVLVPTSISDASSVAVVVATLIAGGTKLVVSLDREGVGGLVRLAGREKVTVLSSTAAVLRAARQLSGMAAAVERLRYLRVGGTGLPADELAAWRAMAPPGCAISHAYASTEALLVTEWVLPQGVAAAGGMVPVGPVVPGVEHALLDEDDRPVPDGQVGAMVVRGRQVALGEWQGGRVVPGRMVPDPTAPGRRVFRTGDLLRRDADGVLHFAGRADRQVKVNGVRVEPAETEMVLRAEPGVTDAAVVQAADGVLHGFVAAPGMGWDDLRPCLLARLRAALPPAMRPGRLHVLPALPLLPSAKHDLAALRQMAEADQA